MRLLMALAAAGILANQGTAAEPSTSTHRHRVLGADKGKVAVVEADGKVSWEYSNPFTVHDLARLPNGNILFQSGAATVVEVSPEKKVVWSYTSKPKAPYKGAIEVHAFQRLADGTTMIAETGNKRIIEVDKDGTIVKEIPLQVDHPHAHRDTRQARKLANGHYLVCHEGDGVVREYDGDGKVVWRYALDLAGRPATPGHGGHRTAVLKAPPQPGGNTILTGRKKKRQNEGHPPRKGVWSTHPD